MLEYRRLTSKNLPTNSSTFDRLITHEENFDAVLAIAKVTTSIQILPVYFPLLAGYD
ncbi:hypothetical protein N44_00995 [Microcystis aeruginosa NIES-44]|uniref:Uncharacterized protein n=1 Tax=Microcystis aeruginosa NIES-44 TaxID=449439 RepID=A0A0A1VRM4_MICAE|nr:hypothetical protein N44_00995 [Microcystis aeruginosa NIES-44]